MMPVTVPTGVASTAPARRVLFVDDDSNVLSGLQRMLRPMRDEWSMQFCASGAEALATLAVQPCDVVVTDMRMAGMDGAALLDEISRSYPSVVRMVLSGQAHQEAILRVVGPAHQYLSKPCDAEELKAKLKQAFVLRDLFANDRLKSLVARLHSLPSVPAVYIELTKEMRSKNVSLARIGSIVELDVAMTAKLLQLVNSAFFGIRREVASAEQAVQLLGLDLVRTLMLSAQLVSHFDAAANLRFMLTQVWQRSLIMSRYVRVVAKLEALPAEVTGYAVTAAMLHDAGRLVLASCIPDEYGGIVDQAVNDRMPLIEAEQQALGCTHAEVGAYLLGLWGLPDQVTTAVAWHHQPLAAGAASLTPLALVHVADAITSDLLPHADHAVPPPLDREFLAALNTRGDYDTWKRECASIGAH
jgi:HD-like signal output (HDOD) protein